MTQQYKNAPGVENPASGQGMNVPASNGKPPSFKGGALPKVDDGLTGREAADTAGPVLDAAIALAKSLEGFSDSTETTLDALRPIMGLLTAEQRGGGLEQALRKHFKTGKDYDSFIASCPSPADEKPAPVFSALSLADVLSMPPKEWLVENLFGAGDLGMIYGPPGSGKTFVVIDLIFAACMGKQFAMRFDVARRLNVAYCAGEGLSGLPDRFKAAVAYHDPGELPGLHVFPQVPQLYTEGGATATSVHQFVIDWKATKKPLDLLIVDTMHSATAGADENSAGHMGKVLDSCKLAIKELRCAVLLVHHTNKAGNGERGSSSLRGAMDFMIAVDPVQSEQVTTKASLQCSKLKDGEAWKPQTFSLASVNDCDSVRIWWDEPIGDSKADDGPKDKILAMLHKRIGEKFTAKEIAVQALGKTNADRHVYALLDTLENDGDILRGLRNPDRDKSSSNPAVYWAAGETAGSDGY